jgi:hypothetical protein
MKKILIGSNLILLVLFLMAYTGKIKDNLPPPQNRDLQLGIDPGLARDMLLKYKNDIWKQRNINGGLEKEARSVWFSLAKLKAFIKDIETNSGTRCVNDTFSLGIRIYFANYPDSTTIRSKGYNSYFENHKLPAEYQNHHTVVLVPTIYNQADSFYYDFDPRKPYFDNSNCLIQRNIKDVMDGLINLKNLPGNNETLVADSKSIIPAKLAYMIMPDNLDGKKFFGRTEINIPINNTNKQKGSNEDDYYFQDVDFTNGGTLVPPPYPEPDGNRVSNSNTRIVHIPGSGASLMRWVDNTNDTGKIRVRIDLKK